METHARYQLIGAFTLAVIFSGFAFVYWLYNTGGLGNRIIYKIEFSTPVTGLLVGSNVLFNGIRVGEVVSLDLDEANPKRVTATTAVSSDVPVAVDTQVRLEFQGLTSAPVINLIGGGEIDSAKKGSGTQTPITLKASPDATGTMTQAAKETLGRIDGFLDRNADPFNDVIENFKTFSDALAKNSDRIETVLKGIERFAGGGSKSEKPETYDLAPPAKLTSAPGKMNGQLSIEEPTIVLAFNTDKILLQNETGEYRGMEGVRWSDNIPNLLQAKIIQSFENAGHQNFVGRALGGIEPEFKLLLDIRKFHITNAEPRNAEIGISAKVVDQDGRILDSRVFSASAPVTELNAKVSVQAMERIFATAMEQLIPWTAGATQKGGPREKAEN